MEEISITGSALVATQRGLIRAAGLTVEEFPAPLN
jgi:hypothetical protein